MRPEYFYVQHKFYGLRKNKNKNPGTAELAAPRATSRRRTLLHVRHRRKEPKLPDCVSLVCKQGWDTAADAARTSTEAAHSTCVSTWNDRLAREVKGERSPPEQHGHGAWCCVFDAAWGWGRTFDIELPSNKCRLFFFT